MSFNVSHYFWSLHQTVGTFQTVLGKLGYWCPHWNGFQGLSNPGGTKILCDMFGYKYEEYHPQICHSSNLDVVQHTSTSWALTIYELTHTTGPNILQSLRPLNSLQGNQHREIAVP